jgi:hypothetical protein
VITFRLRNMNPASVNRYLREIVLQHQQALDRGAFISVTEGKIRVRLLPMTEEQAPLYAQGREDIAAVNVLRREAGMPAIDANANRIVTCARPGYSIHNLGFAFDVAPLNTGKPVWNVSDPVWQRVGMTGKACGLEWAGGWKTFKEYAHFQYTAGLSLAEIREGKRPATSWPDVSGHKLETSLSDVSEKGLGSSPRLITSCDIR